MSFANPYLMFEALLQDAELRGLYDLAPSAWAACCARSATRWPWALLEFQLA